MSPAGARERNAQRRRQDILAATTRLSMARGGAFTVRDLAAEARVTVPTLYSLIGGKDAIVASLIEAGLDAIGKEMSANLGQRGIASAWAVVEATLQIYRTDPDTYRAVFRLLQEVESTSGRAPLGKLFTRAGHLYRTALIEARDDGELKGDLDPTVLAHDVVHAMHHATRLWAVGSLPFRAAAARVRYALCVALLADATAAGRARLLPELRAHEALLLKPAR
jgi:AcrR family transcriptional regulator